MATTPTIWSGPITVSSDPTANSSSIAPLAEGGWVVAFDRAGPGGTASDLVALRFTETGTVVNVNLLASTSTETRDVANPEIVQLAGGGLATGYELAFSSSDGDIYAARNAPASFTPLANIAVDTSTRSDELLEVEATQDGGFALQFYRPSTDQQLFAKANASGVVALAAMEIGTGRYGDLAVLRNGSIVSVDRNVFTILRPSGIGQVAAPEEIDTPGTSSDTQVDALAGGGFVIARSWSDGFVSQIRSAVYSSSGVKLNEQAVDDTGNETPRVTGLADGGYLVGWTNTNNFAPGTDPSVELQRYNANGDAVGLSLVIDQPGTQVIGDLQTLSDGRVLLSYRSETGAETGIFALRTIILDPREASLTFSDANDSVVGRLDDTTINSGAGDDKLTGMGGDDDLNGQAGNDTLKGGAGDDVLKGGSGTDSLDGGSGADQLFGGSGSDLVTGGSGRDVLWGQTGNDVFRYLLASESGTTTATQDIIRDFIQTEDKIDLAGIDAKLGVAGNEAFVFIGGAAFSAEGQVRAVTVGGFTRVEMNTTGASGLEGAILVEGVIAFTSSDFIL